MLLAEKRKAEEHRSFSTISEFSVTSPRGTRSVAANTDSKKRKKAG